MSKRNYLIVIGILVVCFVASTLYIGTAQNVVTWEGILPGISTELGGSYAINVAYTASTVGWDVSEETALTNTVQEIMSLTHTTTGTPAAGIGLEWAATQETSANNNEDIGSVGFYMSDVTAASEDATFSVELMAAGAAKAEVFNVSSVGAGAFDSGLIVNEDSDDSDFRVESDNVTDALKVDAGTDAVQLGAWVDLEIADVAAASYTLASTGRASVYSIDYTTTGAVSFIIDSDVFAVGGRVIMAYDEDGNANSNNVVFYSEGSETFNGSATYTMDADNEAIIMVFDGSNAFVVSGFAE